MNCFCATKPFCTPEMPFQRVSQATGKLKKHCSRKFCLSIATTGQEGTETRAHHAKSRGLLCHCQYLFQCKNNLPALFCLCQEKVSRGGGEGVARPCFQDTSGAPEQVSTWARKRVFSGFAAHSKSYYFPYEYEVIVQNKKGVEWGGPYLARMVLIAGYITSPMTSHQI